MTTDFDGCRRACRAQGRHTLAWGECEHATQPEPTVSMSKIYTASDGHPSIGFDTYTAQQLADLIEPALRKANLAGGYDRLALAAAHQIINRNGEGAR
ncbi:hypothetical protein GTY67_13615 [Streptomyces sp. SID8374]|uniref:hypothetical protein n=1 Tax=Streptomyces sp. SID8374 TaxID=2690354 RepID=UPI00136EF9D2|nr:hypothetical protein [Streptomyces sp. SID8374]MYX14435.1 hypothetical protein [Streptomyces sp. SID8374]